MIKKFFLTMTLSILFILFSLSSGYILSDKILSKMHIRSTFDNCPGLPTVWGTILHASAFGVACFIILIYKDVAPSSTQIKIDAQPNLEEISIHA